MKLTTTAAQNYALVREMIETPEVIRRIDTKQINACAPALESHRLLLSGEGSSRIFPAKKVIADAWRSGYPLQIHTEAATQALEYHLGGAAVFVASNSGKTREGVRLIRTLRERGHSNITGIVAHDATPIAEEADRHYLLCCGNEDAVAATKSVVEQALFYDILLRDLFQAPYSDLDSLAEAFTRVLEMETDDEIVDRLAAAPVLYWAGRNNGVAEELALKTNEITRKKSDYCEGTYVVHGIEEVMNPDEAVILIEPFPEEEEKYTQVLSQGVGLQVVAIASRETSFPTIRIPALGDWTPYLQLAAGWAVLAATGVRLGIDLDKPVRARKVGNEFSG